MTSKDFMRLEERYGANNYQPLPVVLTRGEGVWVWDVEGNRYLDVLAGYSALNQGHRHPRILEALYEQAGRLTLTARAFHNDLLGPLCQELCELTGHEAMLPMNTGAEAVETAIKMARKWGYRVKGIPHDRAEIVVCGGNFHGRTISIVGFSSEEQYRDGFGPFTPGFVRIEYGSAEALRAAITPHTAAFLVEPIQGEGGIIVPPEGFLAETRAVCRDNNVLFMADEIQSGFGRAGTMLACQHENVHPDAVILGKALGGGIVPISAVCASREVMDAAFTPGDHGSTFGGNPLACAVARAALRVLVEERLPERSAELGASFIQKLRDLKSPVVKEVRGRGLWIGVEIEEEAGDARPYCEALLEQGILAKETHKQVLRISPPLVITQAEIDWALERLAVVLAEPRGA